MLFLRLALISFIYLNFACDKDRERPDITFNKKIQAEYILGDTIWFDISITDNIQLKEASFTFKQDSIDSNIIYRFFDQLNDSLLIVDSFIIDSSNIDLLYEIDVVTCDHIGLLSYINIPLSIIKE
jgi:hypothetical protein